MTAQREAAADTEDQPSDLEAGRRVLALGAQGLVELSRSLGAPFVEAVDTLYRTAGKAVVSGMGKSGHVANKIAATLASTGTPAFYVHPAEASHGDLGMISGGDTLILLSNSGETEELRDLVAYARLRGTRLIAIVGRQDSSLAEAADIVLALPGAPEACPLGLAPTTSTTMMMALGDALAVSLMQRRGFSEDHFQVLHPRGRLGRRFVKVEDIMHAGEALPLVGPDLPMSRAILVMTEKRFGLVGVTDSDGHLVGVVTDGDLARHMGEDLLRRRAGEIMTRTPKTIRPKALAAEALGYMNANKITCLFVLDGKRPLGILHVHDILRAGIA